MRLRVAKGLSQRDLGKLAGVSGTAIGKIENGFSSPSIDLLLGLSKALKVPHAKLILAYQGVDPDEITQNDHGIEDISDEELEELARSAQQFINFFNRFKKRKKKE